MFEVGDRIVCINDKYPTPLIIGKIYTINSIAFDKTNCYLLLNEAPYRYKSDWFEDEFYFRRNKILKLKERIHGSR